MAERPHLPGGVARPERSSLRPNITRKKFRRSPPWSTFPRYHSGGGGTTLPAQGPRWGGGGGPPCRPKVQGEVGGGDIVRCPGDLGALKHRVSLGIERERRCHTRGGRACRAR